MAQIHNSDLFKELKDGAKIQQAFDAVPSQLAGQVVPVMEVNPKLLRRVNVVISLDRSTSGVFTVYTTPTDKDFYLTGLSYNLAKDAACDTASGQKNVTVNIDGASRYLIMFPCYTLTAERIDLQKDFSVPIKLDRGAAISNNITWTAGTLYRTMTIYGYTVENPNA